MKRIRVLRRIVVRAVLSLPASWLDRIADALGAPAATVAADPAQRLDPGCRLALRETARGPKLESLGPEVARRRLAALTSLVAWRPARLDSVDECTIGDGMIPADHLRVRILRPPGLANPAPALVYFHGGGWVLGGLDSHHALCRVIAARAGCVVVMVDYRLAPEHPFPAAFDDAVAAYHWTLDQAPRLGLDPARVAVGGDSAGGNLAAAVCLALRASTPPRAQLLLYPVTDTARDTASYRLFASGYGLERSTMDWFFDCYLPPSCDPADWRLAPLRADDLTKLPPAVIGTAGVDVLRDEGDAYAERLRAAGVDVAHRRFDGLIHGFANLGALPAARAAVEQMVDDLAERL